MRLSSAFALWVILMTAPTLAQEPHVWLAAKGGVTIENSEDGLSGTVPAVGVAAGVSFTRHWAAEGEFWLPGYIDDTRGEPTHRDVMFGVSVLRRIGSGPVRPFVIGGLTFARVEDWFTFCSADRVPFGGGAPTRTLVSCDEPDVIDVRREKNAGTDGYLLAGGGADIAVTPRISVLADIRLNLAPASVLVRPGIGISFRF